MIIACGRPPGLWKRNVTGSGQQKVSEGFLIILWCYLAPVTAPKAPGKTIGSRPRWYQEEKNSLKTQVNALQDTDYSELMCLECRENPIIQN